jgi:O-antigen/teichoic acid export membrane protein
LTLSTPTVAETKHRKQFSLMKLVRGSGSRVFHLVLMVAISFFLTPFTVHRLGAEQYGIWALAFAFVGYYSVLDLGLSAAVFTHMSYALGRGDEAEGQRIYQTGLSVFGTIGLILATITLILTFSVGHFYHPTGHTGDGYTMAIVIFLVGMQTAISFPLRVPFGVLNSGSHFDITSGLFILTTILRAGSTFAVLWLHHGVIALALVSFFASLPGNLASLLMVKRKYPYLKVLKVTGGDKLTARKLVNFGFPVLIGQLADRIRLQTDTMTVSFFLGLAAVTHYNIASSLVSYYTDVLVAIIGVLAPLLSVQKSRNDDEGLRRSFFGGTRVAICVAGFIAFGMIAWGHAFVERWMGASFVDAYPVLVILVLAVLLDASQSTAVNALYATMNQKPYAALNMSEAIANLILSIALAKPYGMLGVALGTLIPSVIVRILVQPFVVQKYLGISAWEYLKVSVPTIGRVMLFLLPSWAITHYLLRPDYPSMISVGVLSAITFALPIWYFEFKMRGAEELKVAVLRRLPLGSRP